MTNSQECKDTLRKYFKARIPFISIRTNERNRALEIIMELNEEMQIPIYYHTISQGTRDLLTNRQVSEDRSIIGGLDYAVQRFSQQENNTFVFTDGQDLESNTELIRQFKDIVISAPNTGGSIVVITNTPISGELQRLGMSVTLSPPDEDEMATIIRENIEPYASSMTIEWDEEDIQVAAAILNGVSQMEAENIIATFLASGQILKSDLRELMKAKDQIFADISGIERVMIHEDYQVGGLEGLKMWLEMNEKLLTADLRKSGIRPPRGILLVGVPGCGKSLSAKAIASLWKLPLYRLDLSTIHGQYLGQSESRLKEALQTADHVAPCVLWIDEIEKGLAGAMGGGDGGTSTRIVGQFLYWLQESLARVFVVATANDVSKLPPELLRRGRFDELFFVDLPTEEEREEIIRIYAKKGLGYELSDVLVHELVQMSTGFAGADLEAAVREVVKHSIVKGADSITDQVFIDYFRNVVPLSKTSPEQIDSIRAWGKDRAVPAGKQEKYAESDTMKKTGRTVIV